MNKNTPGPRAAVAAALLACAVLAMLAGGASRAADSAKPVARPALTVTAAVPQRASLPIALAANGNLAAWQEAIIGAETAGLRLALIYSMLGVIGAEIIARTIAGLLGRVGAEAAAAPPPGGPLVLRPGRIHRRFIAVPHGATWMQVLVKRVDDGSGTAHEHPGALAFAALASGGESPAVMRAFAMMRIRCCT